MERIARIEPRRLAALVAFTVAAYAVEVLTVHRVGARMPAQGLAAAVVFDLAVVVPLVWWALALRRLERGVRRIVALVAVSLAGAMLIVPGEGRAIVAGARLLAIPAEIAVLVVGVRAAVRAWRGRREGDDLAERLERAFVSALGANAVARVVAAEATTVAYAIVGGRWRGAGAGAGASAGAGSVHTLASARTPALTWGLVLATVVEGLVVHLVVGERHPAAAWAMTGVGAYAVLWLVGHDRALAARTIAITPEHLVLRAGLRLTARVPWAAVAEARRSGAGQAGAHLDATRPAEANVVVRFRAPIDVTAAFGLRRRVAAVALCVDDPDRLIAAIRAVVD